MPNVSVIVRTKNEERWIGHCLASLQAQSYKDFEVILVDNASTDHTVQVAQRYPLAKIIRIEKFLPGHALNEGIRASKGKFIVCLSAHCIPKGDNWLSALLKNFEADKEEKIAGVYGRQLPLAFTDPVDKRDLLTVFGLDRRVQIKDYFFHNANSMLRRSVWDKFPFDEQVTNIEDRVWGKAVIGAGYQLVYDPEAEVFHHHGLHQGNAPQRARGVVSIIERIDQETMNDLPQSWLPDQVNIAAVVPIQGEIRTGSAECKLLKSSIDLLKSAKYVDGIYLVSNDPSLAKNFDAKWIDRNKIVGVQKLSLDELLKESLTLIEAQKDFPEAIVYVNYDYLHRPEGIFDELIRDAQYKGYDTVFAGYIDYGHYWLKNDSGEYKQTDSSFKSRIEREPVYRALYGQGCLSSSVQVRTGKLVGGKVGILPTIHFKHTLRLKDSETHE